MEVKELGSSKWSNDIDEDDTEKSAGPKENLNALSGLIQAYSKGGKSVHWGDQVSVLLPQIILTPLFKCCIYTSHTSSKLENRISSYKNIY